MNNSNRLSMFQNTTSECSKSGSQLIEKIEKALNITPKAAKGIWSRDETGSLLYKVSEAKSKLFYGPNPLTDNHIVRALHIQTAMTEARHVCDTVFIHGDSNRVAQHGLDLLALRLRGAQPEEDAHLITTAFIHVVGQQDFLDSKRDFDTLDRSTRRHQMRVKRAEDKAIKLQLAGENVTAEEIIAEMLLAEEAKPQVSVVESVDDHVVNDAEQDFEPDTEDGIDDFVDEVSESQLLQLAEKHAFQSSNEPDVMDFDENVY